MEVEEVLDLSSSPLARGASVVTGDRPVEGPVDLAAALDGAAARLDPSLGEGYVLSLDRSGGASAAAGSLAALNRLRSVVGSASAGAVTGTQTLTDAPAFGLRSVNECFYGERWTPEDRIFVMRAAAGYGANAYVYGPSADRRTGGLWREPYSGTERRVMEEFARECVASGVEPIWRISPAAPLEPEKAITISDAEEMELLIAKIRHMIDLGFSRILIAFDDLTAGLDAVTAATFAGSPHPLAAAHASVLRAVGEAVGHERLIACPLHYWGIEPSPYREEFGRGFPAEVPVCWTGPSVISDSICAPDARRVADEVGHPVLVWDNYPVNDWDMDGISALPLHARPGLDNLVVPRRLPLAPSTGRDPGLSDVVIGIGTNMALDPYAGLPAALTVFDFAWEGESYRPEDSWRAAVVSLGIDVDALATLADSAGPGSGVVRGVPSRLARACAAVFLSDDPLADGILDALDVVVAEHVDALAVLRAQPGRLTRDLQPWILELGRQCQLALLAAAALRAPIAERSALVVELSGALGRRSAVVVASGMGRALADYARGLLAGGTPQIDVPDSTSFGY